MEWKSRKVTKLTGWHKRFAWLPVCVSINHINSGAPEYVYVWLATVERSMVGKAYVYREVQ